MKNEIQHSSKKEEKHKGFSHTRFPLWLIPWIILAGLLLIAGVILLPTKFVNYTVETPYIAKEQYTVEVPYEDVESIIVKVPYETQVQYVESVPVTTQQQYIENVCNNQNINYLTEFTKCSTSSLITNGESTLKITNADSIGGNFVINVGYKTASGQFVGNVISNYIAASSYALFSYIPTPSSFLGCSYQIQSLPQKQVCNPVTKEKAVTIYKDVIKTRTETKYKDETQVKKVTKMRVETREREVRKTLTETKQKEVNWIFGFNALIKFRKLN